MSDDLIRRAPECIFCHPTEKQPTSAKNKSQAKWLRGKWKDHDSAASGDVEYIRADLVPAMADRIEAQEALLREAVEALHQYISDMRYPPERDSRDRRIAMAQATLAKLRAHMGETE